MLKVVSIKGLTLQFCDYSLTNDYDVVTTAIQNNSFAL
ncbi:MAG: DUF4116 domain-containing protein [bacterium]